MNIGFILKVVIVVLQLILSGLPEPEAVTQASLSYGVLESLIRKFL